MSERFSSASAAKKASMDTVAAFASGSTAIGAAFVAGGLGFNGFVGLGLFLTISGFLVGAYAVGRMLIDYAKGNGT